MPCGVAAFLTAGLSGLRMMTSNTTNLGASTPLPEGGKSLHIPASRLAQTTRASVSRHTRTAVLHVAQRNSRRSAIAGAVAVVISSLVSNSRAQTTQSQPDRRWYEEAAEMKRLAESWGDQPYGAVLVLNGALVGGGPSRVIKDRNPDAHAEREAIRDAQQRLGRQELSGAVLYSTSRPCSLCEAAAAQAGVSRMYYGPSLTDAGTPSRATR